MTIKEKKAGFIAGISLIAMAIAAGFSYGFVLNELHVDSAEATRQNILENNTLFYSGLAGWVVIFITDLIVSVSLFVFFRNTSKTVSFLTAAIRIIYTIILGTAIFQLFSIASVISADESTTAIMGYFGSFEKIWSAGLIVFGLHLIGLGYLSLKSHTVPRFLGYLLYFAGAAYSLLNTAKQFSTIPADLLNQVEVALSLPMALSEILLAIWLIYKGLKKNNVALNYK